MEENNRNSSINNNKISNMLETIGNKVFLKKIQRTNQTLKAKILKAKTLKMKIIKAEIIKIRMIKVKMRKIKI